MHLGNSLICPVTGGPMIIAMGIASFWAFKKAKKEFSKDKLLPTVMLTAFVFAMQMMNFSIPTTSSSGHIVGAVLLSALLGPYIAFISMCLILIVQGLFFADGGLLALGCNIFNMGFLACFIVYPFVYKVFKNKFTATFIASVCALELGALAVVVEGAISGTVTDTGLFAYLMLTIHLAIGLTEGVFAGFVVLLAEKIKLSKIFSYIFGGIALLIGGFISQFASSKPDGLEWSLINLSANFVESAKGQYTNISEMLQNQLAVISDFQGVLLVMLLTAAICYLSLINIKRKPN